MEKLIIYKDLITIDNRQWDTWEFMHQHEVLSLFFNELDKNSWNFLIPITVVHILKDNKYVIVNGHRKANAFILYKKQDLNSSIIVNVLKTFDELNYNTKKEILKRWFS